MKINSIDKLIISFTSIKRLRNINYKLNSSNSFIINYKSNLIRLEINSKTFNCENFRLKKKRKLNSKIIIYYYRCLNYSKNISQFKKYDINLFKKINNKISYVFYVVKKII